MTPNKPTTALLAVSVLSMMAAVLASPSPAAVAEAGTAPRSGPFATLLFSRTEITAADNCRVNNTGIARLDTTVAPYLAARGMTGTGTLVTDKTLSNALTCTHWNSSMTASWSKAVQLAQQHDWSFTSHTATYPRNLADLTAAQAHAETCGSAKVIDSHGLPGGHGMISYPGAQPQPVSLQTHYAAKCFAWGREYGSNGLTSAAAGQTPPYWQHTLAANGGACNVQTAPCYAIKSTGSPRYQLPSKFINVINGLGRGEWFTLQAYILVTGRSPAYTSSPIRWDCTADSVRLHWTNDNERYCYKDWKAIVRAVDARTQVRVTDPLSVGVAFGRPATYR